MEKISFNVGFNSGSKAFQMLPSSHNFNGHNSNDHNSNGYARGHPFHLVALSPWPILSSFSLFTLAVGFILFMHHYSLGKYISSAGLMSIIYCVWHWWGDVIKEGKTGIYHTEKVQSGLKIGMMIFIISECMFFFAFFFSYFRVSLFPVGILDNFWVVKPGTWPPSGIHPLDPWDIPFINTLILLLSATSLNWAHEAIKNRDTKNALTALAITICLGASFSLLQYYEYRHASFKIDDGVYAANFYLATGFHGVHVIIGTIFLAVCFYRTKSGDFRIGNHLGFEFATWYWHFVDIVWVLLFLFVYVLGR